MIRGYSTDKPVLLYLNGGPGQSGLAFTRVELDDLSRDFVIVDWDQRGAGKSYAALDPTATLTLEQAINDTIELTNYLRQRFDEPKIYLVGESWGSILGVLAVQRQPALFYAFIGSGQMVSVRETDQRFYQDVLDLAARNGNAELAATMRDYGQPPYADIPYANIFAMEQYNALYKPYTPSQAYMDRGNASGIGPYGVLASEYNLVEKFNVLRGLMDMFTVMYPQLQEIDLRRDVQRLDVPVYILDGAAELAARRDLTHRVVQRARCADQAHCSRSKTPRTRWRSSSSSVRRDHARDGAAARPIKIVEEHRRPLTEHCHIRKKDVMTTTLPLDRSACAGCWAASRFWG